MRPRPQHFPVGDVVDDLSGHLNLPSAMLHLHGIGHQKTAVLDVASYMVKCRPGFDLKPLTDLL